MGMTGNSFYNKLHNWLFPIDEHERDTITVPRYNFINSVPFQKVVLDYLAWNGIDKKGNVTSNKVYPTRTQILENKTALAQCRFSTGKYIEKLVVFVFLETKKEIPTLNPELFAHFFEENYHNSKVVKFASEETQKLNQTIKIYYDKTREFLIEIQGYLEFEDLRTRIECNYTETKNPNNYFRVQEFITPFVRIGLNCNTFGSFSINYFINPHLKELVGESLSITLENRFNELVTSEMKDFIKLVPLNRRFDRYFEELVKFTKIYPNYKAIATERNSL